MPTPVPLTASDSRRYARHLVLPEVGLEGQRLLKGSSVLIVGVGGLGVPAAVYLAAAGVGRIGLVDGDAVEITNLQRQFIFNEDDVGRKKAEVAAERLRTINPNVEVTAYAERLTSGNALGTIKPYDLVVDATDDLPTRYLVSDACVMLGKPDVYASAQGVDGQASVFSTSDGPCYRCLYPSPPPPGSVRTCEDAGVLNVIPGILGGLQANQAIGLLTGKGSPLIGRLLVFSGLDNSFDEVRIRKNPACPACGKNPTITQLVDYEEFCGTKRVAAPTQFDLSPEELKASIDSGRAPLLLDVREQYEYDICRLQGAKLIPLGELEERMGELPKDREIVAYCHVGVRSTSAVAILRAAGYAHVQNLMGGIDAWAAQVDPRTPRY